jgi:hypothetical protein
VVTGRTVRLILIDAIQAAGADGLMNRAGQCACLVRDLSPADCLSLECQIGYRRMCSCGDWFLVADRSAATDRCPTCRED